MGRTHGLKVGPGGKIAETLAQLVEIGLVVHITHAVAVAIDIVTDHEEQVGLFPGNHVHDGRGGFFLVLT